MQKKVYHLQAQKFKEMASTYAENYPKESQSINLFRRFKTERSIKEFISADSKTPEIICQSQIIEESDGLLNLENF